MKKIILSSLSVLTLFIGAKAQITITQADFPALGAVWHYADDSVTNFQLTPSGINQTWNYSVFSSYQNSTTNFQNISAAPTAWNSNFPTAQMVDYNMNDSSATYFNFNSTGFYIDGFYSGQENSPITAFDLNPNRLLIPSPFTFGSTQQHFSKAEFSFGLAKIISYQYQEFTGDATGNITTPAGTFNNTLRVKELNYIIDTTYLYNGSTYQYQSSNTAHDTTIQYQWLKNGLNPIVFQVQEKMNGNIGSGVGKQAAYFSNTYTGLSTYSILQKSFAFPNPTHGENNISVSVQDKKAEEIVIIDLLGKIIKTEKVNNNAIVSFNIENLSMGMYIYKITDATNKELSSGKLIVSE